MLTALTIHTFEIVSIFLFHTKQICYFTFQGLFLFIQSGKVKDWLEIAGHKKLFYCSGNFMLSIECSVLYKTGQ